MVDLSKLPIVPGKLTTVTITPPVQVSWRRAPPAVTLRHTGRAILNASATDQLLNLARAVGQKRGEFFILPAADEAAGIIGLYIVEPGTLGSVAPKPIDRGKRTSIDLSGVYELFPGLRANVTRTCTVKLMQDEAGKPCLVIAARGSAVKTPNRRQGGPPENPSENLAPAHQPDSPGPPAEQNTGS